MAEVTVIRIGWAWVAACTDHGRLPVLWDTRAHASLDAMGHAAHHHPRSTR